MKILQIRTLDRDNSRANITREFSGKEMTPNERNKEYMRAVNQVKLDHLFCKPFVGCLEGHTDGITRIVKCSSNDSLIASKGYDGAIMVWGLGSHSCIDSIQKNDSRNNAIAFSKDTLLYSNGSSIFLRDGKYSERVQDYALSIDKPNEVGFRSKGAVLNLCSAGANTFYASTVDGIEVFDKNRIKSIAQFCTNRPPKRIYVPEGQDWLMYSLEGNKINAYDSRTGKQEASIVLKSEVNAISLNPSNQVELAAGLDSGEVHIFNAAYLSNSEEYHTPVNKTLRGHASPVLDITHASNGKKIATGSLDRTVRIFNNHLDSKQEYIYHTKRMLAVNTICCTNDNNYILSGSTDTNIRIWKLDPNRSLKISTRTEEDSRALGDLLKEKYKDVIQIKDMKRHKLVPKRIKSAMRNRYIQLQAEKRKETTRQATAKRTGTADKQPFE
ncbi:DDB1- and CUL4-associated factor 13 [Nematocida sp. AWRm80]|nr:DDB1- and CUL4-associated factor 13 [Nematocida sp. AWRm80]